MKIALGSDHGGFLPHGILLRGGPIEFINRPCGL